MKRFSIISLLASLLIILREIKLQLFDMMTEALENQPVILLRQLPMILQMMPKQRSDS